VASVATAASPTQILTLRSEWRMRMSDLNLRFKEWWNQNNLGKSTPSITSKAVYDVAITHLGVSAERDEADRCDFMYGVRSSSSVSNNGYQAVVYGGASCRRAPPPFLHRGNKKLLLCIFFQCHQHRTRQVKRVPLRVAAAL